MTGRVLRQHDFLSLAILNPEIIDTMNEVAAGYHTVPTGGPIDLLTNDGHSSRIFHQFRREERYHIEGPPKHMTLPAREEIARFYRVIHYRELYVEIVFFGEDALVARLQARVGDDNRSPTRPHIDGKFHDQFAIFRGLRVIAYPGHRGNSRAVNQCGSIRAREEGNVGGSNLGFFIGELLFDLGHVNRLILRPGLGSDLVPPAVNTEANHAEQQDCESDFTSSCHKRESDFRVFQFS